MRSSCPMLKIIALRFSNVMDPEDYAEFNGFNAPQTVYRALKRLMDSGDVHRLESINAYMVCSKHKHVHGPVVFAICRECGHVDELAGDALTKHLKANAKQQGFRVDAVTIELQGKCAFCAKDRTAE